MGKVLHVSLPLTKSPEPLSVTLGGPDGSEPEFVTVNVNALDAVPISCAPKPLLSGPIARMGGVDAVPLTPIESIPPTVDCTRSCACTLPNEFAFGEK
jgi:hypothetical protein